MTLRDLELQDAYDTGNRAEKVVNEFYVPVLGEAVLYKRLTGYFSSQVLALAARGIAGLIKNGGKMQLITSPVVSEEDFKRLTNHDDQTVNDFVNEQFERAMSDINDLAATIAYDHLRALAWMLREELLEIRVLIPSSISAGNGIFHSKVGIVEDSEGNRVSFSGSVNETAMGWTQNIEEFKVFKSWEQGSLNWVEHDNSLFEKYWSHAQSSGFETVPLPRKSVEKLIKIAPTELVELQLSVESVSQTKQPREYQNAAIKTWVSAGYKGILEMATGTGKTFTARQCVNTWKTGKDNSIILIAAPTQTVASQWIEVMKDLDPISTFDGKPWRENLRKAGSQTKLGFTSHLVIVAIQNTASSNDFLEIFNNLKYFTENSLIIADEVHGLGAPVFRKALNEGINSRLGLTATPDRWFDDEGTDVLKDYFGGVIFKFGLHEALTWIDPISGQTPLCPYNYYPEFVTLDQDEIDQYLEFTRKIIMQSNKASDPEGQERLNRLMEKRASVLKRAHSKFDSLRSVLNSIEDITGTLIYCSDREQINEVIEIISKFRFTYRTFTGDEGTTPKKEFQGKSERDWILEDFENQNIQILIAMKCLDEGVDIPSAKTGIIMASTTNPREFIQRRGRLLRRAKGKPVSNIYDMIVAPVFEEHDQSDVIETARKIMGKEMNRVQEFSDDAVNASDISSMVLGRMLEMGNAK